MPKYPDSAYLEAALFEDRDLQMRCESRKLVTTRSPHRCAFADSIGESHEIPASSRAIMESAIVEGRWGRAWSCLDCVDGWLDHIKWTAS